MQVSHYKAWCSDATCAKTTFCGTDVTDNAQWLLLRKKGGHATVINTDHRHPEEHLQTERCGVITVAAFRIKQMKLRPQICVLWPSSWLEWTRSLCADSLTLMLFECDIPHGPASTGTRNRRKLESKQSKEWTRRTKRSMKRMWMDG